MKRSLLIECDFFEILIVLSEEQANTTFNGTDLALTEEDRWVLANAYGDALRTAPLSQRKVLSWSPERSRWHSLP